MDKTADGILALRDAEARTLFPGDEQAISKAFHALAMLWHPDRCRDSRAGEVFTRLIALKAAALRIAEAAAGSARVESFSARDGKRFEFRYRTRHAIDGGEVFVGDTTLCYVLGKDYEDIARAGIERINALTYANEAMRKEMARFLPTLRKVIETDDGIVMVQTKTEDQFLLADLIRANDGRLEPTHVAWIVSGLLNIGNYLAWAGMSHGAIDGFNLLISPRYHSVALAGGWGFATKLGERPKALPGRTLASLPSMTITGTVSEPVVDLELIRLTARECLGDPAGNRLFMDKAVPGALTEWLMLPPAKSAFDDYGEWPRVLERSFGKRRFVEWEVLPEVVYGTA